MSIFYVVYLVIFLLTSWTELRREAMGCDEWNLLHPDGEPRVPYVTSALADHHGPVVAVSDWIRAVPDQIARWVSAPYSSLGTDGWGLSDTRRRPGGTSTWTPSRSRSRC